MFDLNSLIKDTPPYSLPQKEKDLLYSNALFELIKHHYERCPPYRRILDLLEFDPTIKHPLEALPFLPVRLFKELDLQSVEPRLITKTMTSSGTSGQKVSKIFLDQETASNQTRVLWKIMSNFIGSKRLPLLIIDSEEIVKNRQAFSARAAGILGFSLLGTDITYALDKDLKLDLSSIQNFSKKHTEETILVFGFTYVVWANFVQKLKSISQRVPLDNGILFHGGGWKKMVDEAVDNVTFKRTIESVTNIKRVHNYYGMVEQTGSIFMECEAGNLHCSIFSDIIIRNTDFSACGKGEPGLVELVSLLPNSYPGHIILSEDMGEIIGEDDCTCGRLGKYFRIHGRIAQAELRGCSDTPNAVGEIS